MNLSQSFSIPSFFSFAATSSSQCVLTSAPGCKVKINSFWVENLPSRWRSASPASIIHGLLVRPTAALVIKVKRLHAEKLCIPPSGRATQVAYLLMRLREGGVIVGVTRFRLFRLLKCIFAEINSYFTSLKEVF
jgi:hypothetical protein